MFDLILQLGHVLLLLLPADTRGLSVLDHPLLPLDVPQLLRGGGDGGAAGDEGTRSDLGLDDDAGGGGRPGLVADQDEGRLGGGHHGLAQLGDGDLGGEGDGVGGEGLGEDGVEAGEDVVVLDWGERRGVVLAAGGGRLGLDTVAVAAVWVGVGEVLHQDVAQHAGLQALYGRQTRRCCHAVRAEIYEE